MGKDVIRAVVADDDAGMRLVMRKLIERQEGYELVGEYPSGEALMAEFVVQLGQLYNAGARRVNGLIGSDLTKIPAAFHLISVINHARAA